MKALSTGNEPMSPIAELVKRNWTISELRKLPRELQDAILEYQTKLAEPYYRNDPELTAFEAFGPDDLYGASANDETIRRMAGGIRSRRRGRNPKD